MIWSRFRSIPGFCDHSRPQQQCSPPTPVWTCACSAHSGTLRLSDLVKIFDFRLSLRIEPGSSSPRLVSSKEDLAGIVATPCRVGANLLVAQMWPPALALTVEPKGAVQLRGWPIRLSLPTARPPQPVCAPDHSESLWAPLHWDPESPREARSEPQVGSING